MSLRRAIEEQDAKERALLERVERLQGEIGETLASLPGGVGEKSGELFQAWSRLNVELMETRPASATKRWRVVKILEKAK